MQVWSCQPEGLNGSRAPVSEKSAEPVPEEAESSSSQTAQESVDPAPTQTGQEPVHPAAAQSISEEAESSGSQTDSESDSEFVDAMATQPVPVRGQAVFVDGEYYDICVKYGNTGKIFLLVKSFERVKAPGILRQEAEESAGCQGILEDEEEGLFWSSLDPLEKKGCYIFYPDPEKDGFEVMVEKLVGAVTWAITAPVRAVVSPPARTPEKRA